MKRPRPSKRIFSGLAYDPAAPRNIATAGGQTTHAVTPEEVEQFIANIAATGCYDDQFGKVTPVSADRRNAACDWVEQVTSMPPPARAEFLVWATEQAQLAMYGVLDSPSATSPLIFGNQAQ